MQKVRLEISPVQSSLYLSELRTDEPSSELELGLQRIGPGWARPCRGASGSQNIDC